ncbi:hypothetical protein Tco_0268022 [Tanacetum coccineum]
MKEYILIIGIDEGNYWITALEATIATDLENSSLENIISTHLNNGYNKDLIESSKKGAVPELILHRSRDLTISRYELLCSIAEVGGESYNE